MPTACGQAFSVPLSRKRPERKTLDKKAEDLEFSEYGRSPGVPPGWYVLPTFLIGVAVLVLLLLLI